MNGKKIFVTFKNAFDKITPKHFGLMRHTYEIESHDLTIISDLRIKWKSMGQLIDYYQVIDELDMHTLTFHLPYSNILFLQLPICNYS